MCSPALHSPAAFVLAKGWTKCIQAGLKHQGSDPEAKKTIQGQTLQEQIFRWWIPLNQNGDAGRQADR